MKRLLSTLAIFLLIAAPAFGQNPESQRQAIDKLSFLEGEWQGEAWTVLPDGTRLELDQTERVRRTVGGLALIIEGEGRDKTSNDVIYEAMATVFHDFQTNDYYMYGGTSDGRNGPMDFEILDDRRLRWAPKGMAANVRYTISMSDDNQWHEVGEYSQDGQNWMQFFEMTLRRAEP